MPKLNLEIDFGKKGVLFTTAALVCYFAVKKRKKSTNLQEQLDELSHQISLLRNMKGE